MTQEIHFLLKIRQAAFKSDGLEQYTKLRSDLRKAIREAKRQYLATLNAQTYQTNRLPLPKVALTSITMKCFVKLVMAHINSSFPTCLDPLLFAYQHNRSTEDAISRALHSSPEYLKKGTYVRLLLIDYRSIFNTIIPSRMISKLHDLGLSSA
eukprot:g28297.t1